MCPGDGVETAAERCVPGAVRVFMLVLLVLFLPSSFSSPRADPRPRASAPRVLRLRVLRKSRIGNELKSSDFCDGQRGSLLMWPYSPRVFISADKRRRAASISKYKTRHDAYIY